jgi:hypothetical protein
MKKTERKRLGIRQEVISTLTGIEAAGIRGGIITYTQTNEDCTTLPGGGGQTTVFSCRPCPIPEPFKA